jgi:hypothetical protein
MPLFYDIELLWNKIRNDKVKAKDLVNPYSSAMRMKRDLTKIDEAIIKRWSEESLEDLKAEAKELIESKRKK